MQCNVAMPRVLVLLFCFLCVLALACLRLKKEGPHASASSGDAEGHAHTAGFRTSLFGMQRLALRLPLGTAPPLTHLAHRRMTIMSSYRLPSMLRQRKRAQAIEAVAKQSEGLPGVAAAATPAQLAAAEGAVHAIEGSGSGSASDAPGGQASGSRGALVAPAGQLAHSDARSDDNDEDDNENTAIALQRVLQDLERRGELHNETMKLIEAVPEWRNYDSHVSFELTLLRHRYQSGDVPMTSQRRNQMQAHLRKAQQEIMELHAEQAAAAFVESLTPSEAEELRKRLLRIDPGGLELVEASEETKAAREEVGALPDGGVDFDKMKSALWEVSKAIGGAGGEAGGAAGGKERVGATGEVGSGRVEGVPGASSASHSPRMVGQRRK